MYEVLHAKWQESNGKALLLLQSFFTRFLQNLSNKMLLLDHIIIKLFLDFSAAHLNTWKPQAWNVYWDSMVKAHTWEQ